MAEPTRYASFIVRLWRESANAATDAGEPVWMGELESIQTGHARQFQGLNSLLPLLAAHLVDNPPAGRSPTK
ncbi:MAG: hypothetical protein KDE20_00085 [Caldilineaceae bacterium]|nr:hypothetical protein [Caldilineaceae bacterium]MCB0069814.1 hypothetical protein [Caldilineaceae bacterium]